MGKREREDQPLGTGVTREKRERETGRHREKDREIGGGHGPFEREYSECAQEALLVATAKDLHPKVRPVQMLEC